MITVQVTKQTGVSVSAASTAPTSVVVSDVGAASVDVKPYVVDSPSYDGEYTVASSTAAQTL